VEERGSPPMEGSGGARRNKVQVSTGVDWGNEGGEWKKTRPFGGVFPVRGIAMRGKSSKADWKKGPQQKVHLSRSPGRQESQGRRKRGVIKPRLLYWVSLPGH